MIKIKNVTMRNFFSIGAVTQAVDLSRDPLTLVLGQNLDVGSESDNTKNGVGKTALINAISYALYGSALSNIKKPNLVNKTNKTNMVVTVDFEKDGVNYRIERGRGPVFLKFYINDAEQEITDESQGDSRQTQRFIESLLGMSHDLFKLLVALNTYSKPFLSMSAGDQRSVIEQLLGVTILSEKAEALKLQIRDTKDQINIENTRINATKSANAKISDTIHSLKTRQNAWTQSKKSDLAKYQSALTVLSELDTDAELKNHEILAQIRETQSKRTYLQKEQQNLNRSIQNYTRIIEKLSNEISELEKSQCYACGQHLQTHVQQEIIEKKTSELNNNTVQLESVMNQLSDIENELDSLPETANPPEVFYESVKDVYEHRNNVDKLQSQIVNREKETDPYHDQIHELENTTLQPIDWSTINRLNEYLEHQEFLLKLLTNKDSFIRKKIIDQNLSYLNLRLTHYLSGLGLPHLVSFQNDLTVEITMLGQDLDFDNLSRGERTRLVLGLSFAFRDVWEGLQHNLNLMCVDELLDSGLDGAGIENSLAVLTHMSRNRQMNIFLISHREELVGRVNNTLSVIKENGFTRFDMEESNGRDQEQE